jgi:hypothetical protein
MREMLNPFNIHVQMKYRNPYGVPLVEYNFQIMRRVNDEPLKLVEHKHTLAITANEMEFVNVDSWKKYQTEYILKKFFRDFMNESGRLWNMV